MAEIRHLGSWRQNATVHHTKKLTRPRKLPGPWTTTWCTEYLSAVHPVTCSLLWVRYLFDLISMSDFEGKWPLKWNFRKYLSRFLDGTPNYVSRPTLVKIGRCEVRVENLGSTGLVPAPILAKIGRSRPKFSERCHPLTFLRVPNLVGIRCVLPDHSGAHGVGSLRYAVCQMHWWNPPGARSIM